MNRRVVGLVVLVGALGVASGCSTLLGIQDVEKPAGGDAGGNDGTASDSAGQGPDVTQGDDAASSDSAGDVAFDTNQTSNADAGTCTANEPCDAGTCKNGMTSCTTGHSTCVAVNGTNGTECGDASVCNAGSCVPCASGTDCSEAGSCEKMTIACGTGTPVCSGAGNQPNGTSCGDASVCNGGSCGPCTAGLSCPPSSAPCNAGLTSCTTGVETCADQGTPASAGTTCGTNEVCNGTGQCVPCTAGLSCTPTNVCDLGTTDCSTGTQVCMDTGPNASAHGTTCGTNEVCNSTGQCEPCATGAACTPSNICDLGSTNCSTGTPVCTDTGPNSSANGTICGTNEVCNAGTCSAGCFIGGTFYSGYTMCSGVCTNMQPDALCANGLATCGNLSTGLCGQSQVSNCGACPPFEHCGYGGTSNVCGKAWPKGALGALTVAAGGHLTLPPVPTGTTPETYYDYTTINIGVGGVLEIPGPTGGGWTIIASSGDAIISGSIVVDPTDQPAGTVVSDWLPCPDGTHCTTATALSFTVPAQAPGGAGGGGVGDGSPGGTQSAGNAGGGEGGTYWGCNGHSPVNTAGGPASATSGGSGAQAYGCGEAGGAGGTSPGGAGQPGQGGGCGCCGSGGEGGGGGGGFRGANNANGLALYVLGSLSGTGTIAASGGVGGNGGAGGPGGGCGWDSVFSCNFCASGGSGGGGGGGGAGGAVVLDVFGLMSLPAANVTTSGGAGGAGGAPGGSGATGPNGLSGASGVVTLPTPSEIGAVCTTPATPGTCQSGLTCFQPATCSTKDVCTKSCLTTADCPIGRCATVGGSKLCALSCDTQADCFRSDFVCDNTQGACVPDCRIQGYGYCTGTSVCSSLTGLCTTTTCSGGGCPAGQVCTAANVCQPNCTLLGGNSCSTACDCPSSYRCISGSCLACPVGQSCNSTTLVCQ